jgi:glutamyl-tRNA synthetase
VRYAPSPTGFLHLGGLRTALFNFLFARATGGTYLLRIEDTDQARQVPGSVEGLIRALQWCGVHHDEGPMLTRGTGGEEVVTQAGPAGPYIQSQRLPLYRATAEGMLAAGTAYRCFCTPHRLAALREAQSKRAATTLYDRACLKLPAGEAERRAAAGEPHVIRLRVPDGADHVSFADQVVGPVRFAAAVVDDQVLLKSDGFPTYHLASVVDDHAMGISHVIRGQEWLSSTPKHVLTYRALGWEPPAFAHLPLLLNPDRSKLSKRHGDAAVEDFQVRLRRGGEGGGARKCASHRSRVQQTGMYRSGVAGGRRVCAAHIVAPAQSRTARVVGSRLQRPALSRRCDTQPLLPDRLPRLTTDP